MRDGKPKPKQFVYKSLWSYTWSISTAIPNKMGDIIDVGLTDCVRAWPMLLRLTSSFTIVSMKICVISMETGRSGLVPCLFLFYPDIVSHLGFWSMMPIPEPTNFVKVGYRVMCNKLTYICSNQISKKISKIWTFFYLTNIFSFFIFGGKRGKRGQI